MDQQIDNKLLYQILFIVGIFMHRIENVHCVTTAEADRTLSNNIYRIIDHFQQDDPIGLPIEAIPDPFPVEDVSHVLAACLCRMTTTNTRAHGFSKFRVGFAHFDAKSLVVTIIYNIFDYFVIVRVIRIKIDFAISLKQKSN